MFRCRKKGAGKRVWVSGHAEGELRSVSIKEAMKEAAARDARHGTAPRDLFAAEAMHIMALQPSATGGQHPSDEMIAEWSYGLADAMMAERAKRKK